MGENACDPDTQCLGLRRAGNASGVVPLIRKVRFA